MFVKIDASLERNRIYNRKSATVSMALIHYLHTNIMHLCTVTELEANYHHHPKMIADDYRWWWWWWSMMMMMTMMMIIRQHLHKARHELIQYLDSLYYCLLPACCLASLLLDRSTTIIRCSHRSFDLPVCCHAPLFITFRGPRVIIIGWPRDDDDDDDDQDDLVGK